MTGRKKQGDPLWSLVKLRVPMPPPDECPDCGRRGLAPWEERCPHRRACEGRQMLRDGVDSAIAAAHAQGLS